MAKRTIIFLLKVVYFSIERWDTFGLTNTKEDFSVVVSYEAIAEKNHSFSAGQYFDVKIEYIDITHEEFEEKMSGFKNRLLGLFNESKTLEEEMKKQLEGLKYE